MLGSVADRQDDVDVVAAVASRRGLADRRLWKAAVLAGVLRFVVLGLRGACLTLMDPVGFNHRMSKAAVLDQPSILLRRMRA